MAVWTYINQAGGKDFWSSLSRSHESLSIHVCKTILYYRIHLLVMRKRDFFFWGAFSTFWTRRTKGLPPWEDVALQYRQKLCKTCFSLRCQIWYQELAASKWALRFSNLIYIPEGKWKCFTFSLQPHPTDQDPAFGTSIQSHEQEIVISRTVILGSCILRLDLLFQTYENINWMYLMTDHLEAANRSHTWGFFFFYPSIVNKRK